MIMPRGDGTGPIGGGSRFGLGRGAGQGRRRAEGVGVDGKCICPSCGNIVNHQIGIPCNQIKCTKCGTLMVRE